MIWFLVLSILKSIALVFFLLCCFLVGTALTWIFRYKYISRNCNHLPVPPKAAKQASPTFSSSCSPGAMEDLYDDIFSLANEEFVLPPAIFMGFFLGGCATAFITDADAIKTIATKSDEFQKPKEFYYPLEGIIGNGLGASSGSLHKRQRKLLTPLFHFSHLKNTIHEAIDMEIPNFINRLKLTEGIFNNGSEIFGKFTMKVIIRTTFGSKFDHIWMADKFEQVAENWMLYYAGGSLIFGHTIWSAIPFSNPFTQGIKEIRTKISDALEDYKKEYNGKNNKNRNDMLAFLFDAQMKSFGKIDRELLIDECLTFLFAGHDTSGNVLSWWAYFIAKDEKIQKKVQKEIDDYVTNNSIGGHITNVSELKYLKQTIQETLRLRPPAVGLGRDNPNGLDVNGVYVPPGVKVQISVYLVQTNGKYWKNPLVFNPDRFDEINNDRHPYAYIPFSAGPRGCIGQKFAMQEMLLCTSNILKNFTIHYDDSKQVRMSCKTLCVPHNLFLKFEKR